MKDFLLWLFVFWQIRSVVAIWASVNQPGKKDCVRFWEGRAGFVWGGWGFFSLHMSEWRPLIWVSFLSMQIEKELKCKLQWIHFLMKEHFIWVCIKTFRGKAYFKYFLGFRREFTHWWCGCFFTWVRGRCRVESFFKQFRFLPSFQVHSVPEQSRVEKSIFLPGLILL